MTASARAGTPASWTPCATWTTRSRWCTCSPRCPRSSASTSCPRPCTMRGACAWSGRPTLCARTRCARCLSASRASTSRPLCWGRASPGWCPTSWPRWGSPLGCGSALPSITCPASRGCMYACAAHFLGMACAGLSACHTPGRWVQACLAATRQGDARATGGGSGRRPAHSQPLPLCLRLLGARSPPALARQVLPGDVDFRVMMTFLEFYNRPPALRALQAVPHAGRALPPPSWTSAWTLWPLAWRPSCTSWLSRVQTRPLQVRCTGIRLHLSQAAAQRWLTMQHARVLQPSVAAQEVAAAVQASLPSVVLCPR